MFRKNNLMFLVITALLLVGGVSVFGQDAPVKGKVQIKKADGTTAPVEGATIDIYQMDTNSKMGSAKTDAQGMFSSADGVPSGKTFAVVVSAPNVKPQVTPDVKGGQSVTIMVSEGNGEVPTEEEVKDVLLTSKVDPNSAEGKKILAEREKKAAEINAKNDKAKVSNETINRALKEGNEAYSAKNYDLAISKYDEGYNAAPDFAGSAPVMLNNKANALIKRAVTKYNESVKIDPATKKSDPAAKAAALPSVKKDFEDTIDASDKSLAVLKTAAADSANKKSYDDQKLQALTNRKDAFLLLIKTGADRTKGKEAAAAFEEYIAAEPDAKKKADTQLALAQSLQDSQEFDQATAEFEKVLAQDPNNVDALSGAGFSLVNIAYNNNDKSKFQEAINYLQKFVQVAPDSNQYKEDAKSLIETLKKEQNVTPQKVTTPTKKKSS